MKVKNYTNDYRIDVSPLTEEDGGGYEAVFPQLARMIVGYGETQAEAVQDLIDFVPLLLKSMEEIGDKMPEPVAPPEWKDYNGRVTLRLPKMLHYQLDKLADQEGVSMNSLLTTILQSGATAMAAGCQFGIASTPEAVQEQSQQDSYREVFEEFAGVIRKVAESQVEYQESTPAFERQFEDLKNAPQLPDNWEILKKA